MGKSARRQYNPSMSPETTARRPLAASSSRRREPTIVPVSQVLLTLSEGDNNEAFSKAQREILKWMSARAGPQLPPQAWEGASFELEEIGAQRTAAIALDQPKYWAARLDDADKVVAQRVWTTEIGIAEEPSGNVLVGARLVCSARGDNPAFIRTVPGFVRGIVQNCDVYIDSRRIDDQPWLIHDEDSVDALVSLLAKKNRRNNVIVYSLPEGSVEPSEVLGSPENLAKRLAGVAHVAVITSPASFALTDIVGKEFSVFRQAIRTYRPDFDWRLDEPFRHPLGLPERVSKWPNGGLAAYEGVLISQALAATVFLEDRERELPSFAMVRRAAAEIRRATADHQEKPERDRLELADAEISELKQSLDEERETLTGLLKVAEEERDQAIGEAEQLDATAVHLRHRIEQLESKLREAQLEVSIPSSLDGFESWASENLSGYVVLHNRALRGAKDSVYDDTSLIYKSLLLLKNEYVAMRRHGGLDLKESYEKKCQELGITEEATFAGDRSGEEGDTYFVRYSGRRVELDRHLKKGNSRDPRYCFRLYFFWDERTQQAIVGWLPSHLTNRAS